MVVRSTGPKTTARRQPDLLSGMAGSSGTFAQVCGSVGVLVSVCGLRAPCEAGLGTTSEARSSTPESYIRGAALFPSGPPRA